MSLALKRPRNAILAVGILSTLCVAAALALPSSIGNRIVESIMNFGDKHIGGPFKKGGGDEAATRRILSDIFMPVSPWKAAEDVSVGTESNTGTPTQDAPGYSQANGVPMPSGAHQQTAMDRPRVDPENPAAPQPSITAPVPSVQGPGISHPGGGDAPEHSPHDNVASATQHPNQIELRAGEHTFAQAEPTPNFNPNPEATGGAPSAPAPAATPASAPAPTPAARERNTGAGGGGGGPMKGAVEISHGRDVTPAEMSRASSTS